jgi:uncharacterized membrane protein YGL010W
MLRLNAEWSQLMKNYESDHQHPLNRAFHGIGIPLIAASVPVGATVIGLPLAVGLFSLGWGFQLTGHLIEGKRPSFVDDKRYLAVGALWYLKKFNLLETASVSS